MNVFRNFLVAGFGLGLVFMSFNGVFAEGEFSDLEGIRYRENVVRLAEMGVINGYADGTFRPENKVNRAEMIKIVFAYLEEGAESYGGGCFEDVGGEWFAGYVCRAKELGIVSGYEGRFYRPGAEVNMVEALKIVMESFDLPVDGVKEGEKWYIPYMEFAHENDLFSKYGYLPGKSATREEVAFLVDRVGEIQRNESYLYAERNTASLGCGQTTPSSPPTKFTVRGVERSTITVIPRDYIPSEQVAVVFAFHGRTNSNERVRSYYGIEKADFKKAIFIYPAGIQRASGYTWSDGGDAPGNLRDYEFFDVILEEVASKYCVNMDEIYAVGHSLGGWFTNSLACARGDVLKGVASLGGSRTNSSCTGPVAVMQWHNPNDALASFSSGEVARNWFLDQNQCSREAVPVEPAAGSCVLYQGCGDFTPVVWCPHTNDYDSRGQYYTHNWPSFAGKEMLKFFTGLK
ncbi:hypothetical protein CVV38_03995 [Candidatus Peregrinibacteria bacterium HGW-Peregrinibacteria-1]|jgi:polyhydroxybutyrate depolymerase|nr:MAG: hypothetical protein CVV38_03995 [Candidatus Peregrinibacteria bacterium HGW-Peregrinibacteria-1]